MTEKDVGLKIPENMDVNEFYIDIRLKLLDKKLEILYYIRKKYLAHLKSRDDASCIIELLNQPSFDVSDLEVFPQSTYDEIENLSDLVKEIEETCIKNNDLLILHYIETQLQLSDFGQLCLDLALAYELKEKYQRIFLLLTEPSSQQPTYQLAYELFNMFVGPKMNIRTLQVTEKVLMHMIMKAAKSAHDPMVLDDDVLLWLLNHVEVGTSSLNFTKQYMPHHTPETINYKPSVLEHMNDYLIASKVSKDLVFLSGAKGVGKSYQVFQWAKENMCGLIVVNYLDLINSDEDLNDYFYKLIRNVNLLNGVFLFENYTHSKDSKREKWFLELIENTCSFVFMTSREPLPHDVSFQSYSILELEIDLLSYDERLKLWQSLALERGIFCDSFKQVASTFKFSIGTIKTVIEKLYALEHWRHDGIRVSEKRIFEVCYKEIEHELGKTARKLKPIYHFVDLVLPDLLTKELHEICSRVKNQHIVYDEWGFGKKLSYGKGLSIIFSGEPGTGKTMAAHAIANELKLEIYQIDLSAMVSKYIGETEKNLDKIFEEASRSNAILFFDEAESLFGKRTEVSNSNDKHANTQTAFLLQRIEAYEGITILATNFLKSMDKAFIRRINHILDFHMPSIEFRQAIWQKIYPKELPISTDVDFDYVASRFELTGGNIKNIALRSAFIAAEKETDVTMTEILLSVKEEMHKIGKVFIYDEDDEYADIFKGV